MGRTITDYSRFLTPVSAARRPDPIRETVSLRENASPDLIFLGGGLPSSDTVPIGELSFTLKDGKKIDVDSKLLKNALQYGPTEGFTPLRNILKEIIQRFHNPPLWNTGGSQNETDLVVTPGGQDGMSRTVDMLINAGDYVIVQEPCYSGMLTHLNALGVKYLPVKTDDDGMDIVALRQSLSRWDPNQIRDQRGNVPKVLYLNPNGSNPCGMTFSTRRRKEIYSIAQEFNLIIMEDDPYYFLQYTSPENYSPSFLSLDTDGRVIRFDSFAKLMSAGLRLGYTVGPKLLVDRIMMHMQASCLHTSGVSQVIAYEILKYWGTQGLLDHVKFISNLYMERRDVMVAAANKHLKGLCEWSVPKGGMFLWFTVPRVKDTAVMIKERGLSKNIVLVPGDNYMPGRPICNTLRASFSCASFEDMKKGMQLLAEIILEEIDRQ